MLWKNFLLEADKGNAGGGSGDGGAGGDSNNGGQNNPPPDFTTWLGSQPEEVKTLLETHEAGLKSALKSERESRSDLERQLRDAAKKAEKGSEMETQLTEMADKLGTMERQADFYEAAHAAGVSNLKLAYMVASSDELFDKRGQVNFETMKQSYPELFGGAKKQPAGNAGAGINNQQPPATGMNAFIRKAAGRE